VFQRLGESQSSVSWSDGAVAEDRAFRRWATIVLTVIVLILLATAAFAYRWWVTNKGGGG
jgi:hypothetical protein